MPSSKNFKYLLISLIALLVFTQGLIFVHNSKFEKGEFDRICNSIYTEKVWINKCYFPYNEEIKTLNLVTNIEIAGIIFAFASLLYSYKLNIKK